MPMFFPKHSGCNPPTRVSEGASRFYTPTSSDWDIRAQAKSPWFSQSSRLPSELARVGSQYKYESLVTRWFSQTKSFPIHSKHRARSEPILQFVQMLRRALDPDRNGENPDDPYHHNASTMDLNRCSRD